MRYFLYNFELFFLVFLRVFGMLSAAPVFSSAVLSLSWRGMLAFLLAVVVFPLVTRRPPSIPDGMGLYAAVAVSELLVGLVIGVLASVFFAVFQTAGAFFSLQMGLGISEVLDPMTQEETPVMGQFLTLVGTLVFLAIGGEAHLIEAVARSFEVVPVLDWSSPEAMRRLTEGFLATAGQMLLLALKLALPLMGTLAVLVVSLALLSKAAPQMNIFMVGFPVQLTVGFVSLVLLAPTMAWASRKVFEVMRGEILALVAALGKVS